MQLIFKKRYWIFILAIIFLVAAAIVVYGFIPVIKINGKAVVFSEYLETYSALKSYDKLSQRSATSGDELKRRALETLVENKFVDILAERTSTDFKKEAEKLVEDSIKTTPNLSLGEVSKKIYGLSEADFKRLVLFPQAEKDLLIQHYSYNPAELQNLLSDLARNAQVKIYYPGFYWDGEVKIKK